MVTGLIVTRISHIAVSYQRSAQAPELVRGDEHRTNVDSDGIGSVYTQRHLYQLHSGRDFTRIPA